MDELRTWVETVAGGKVRGDARLPTVRPAWKVELQAAAGSTIPYILRCARPAGFGLSEVYSLEREAVILRALHKAGMPVPALVGACAEPAALLLECMPGRSDYPRLEENPTHRETVVRHFMQLLARLHSLSPKELGLDQTLTAPRHPRDHALLELDTWEGLYRRSARTVDPLLAFTLRWLRTQVPESAVTVLVQGDTGPNQCLFDENGITAVLDWELAHLGDPMEDLGWMAARAHFADFGSLKEQFQRYAELSGRPLEPRKIGYYRVLALLKCAVATGLARASMGPADDLASITSWDVVTRLSLTWSLMTAMGLPAAVTDTELKIQLAELGPLAEEPLYRVFADIFREQARTQADSFQTQRLSGLGDMITYLAAAAAAKELLRRLERAEWESLSRRLDLPPGAAVTDLRGLIEGAHPRHDADFAGYFHRQELRSMALVERSLGGRVRISFDSFE